jgi:hypothetical protein
MQTKSFKSSNFFMGAHKRFLPRASIFTVDFFNVLKSLDSKEKSKRFSVSINNVGTNFDFQQHPNFCKGASISLQFSTTKFSYGGYPTEFAGPTQNPKKLSEHQIYQ